MLFRSCGPLSGSTFLLGNTTDVTCTATDDAGNSSSTNFTVTVTTEPLPNLALISAQSQTVRQGDPIILTADIIYSQGGFLQYPEGVQQQ